MGFSMIEAHIAPRFAEEFLELLYNFHTENFEKGGKKIKEAKEADVHVISEDYVEAAKKGGGAILIPQHSLCSWGADVSLRVYFLTNCFTLTKDLWNILYLYTIIGNYFILNYCQIIAFHWFFSCNIYLDKYL